jgi:hypothetical protein
VERGDLIIVTEEFPDWEWRDWHTGDIGIVMKVRKLTPDFIALNVLFLKNNVMAVIPIDYVSLLEEER